MTDNATHTYDLETFRKRVRRRLIYFVYVLVTSHIAKHLIEPHFSSRLSNLTTIFLISQMPILYNTYIHNWLLRPFNQDY